jgi:hypothetical protein
MRYSPFALIPLLLAACTDQEPLGPDTTPLFSASARMNKAHISGELLGPFGAEGPTRTVITPSGMCHFWERTIFTELSGSIVGPVAFHERQHFKCDFSRFVGSGPFEGEVIWNGRSGAISGQWTTNCKPDASQLLGLSCDGTMNARGSGGLEGVMLHMKWGPGWYPFPYTGTAFFK